MTRIAEIISIGDELASGERLDTNSQWLSQRLAELGIHTLYHTTVADDLAANVAVFRLALERADIVVASGGLGPTADDLTRDAITAAIGAELYLDQPSLDHIRGLFARHNREMPQRNVLQAKFPLGSRPIFNPGGTAPGILLEHERPGRSACLLFALPGVPAEMREMFFATVGPAVVATLDQPRMIRHRRIKCFGAGESQVEAMLPDLIRRGREPSVGITVHEATITLRITAAGRTPDECLDATRETEETIRGALGNLVFGEEDDELEDVVAGLLKGRKQTVATIEWGTRGQLGRWLARAGSGSGCLTGSLIVDSHEAAQRLLGAGGATARAENAGPHAGAELAGWMADGCRRVLASDYALAIGPFPAVAPEPSAGEPLGSEPAQMYFALASADKTTVRSATLAHHPAIWEPRAAKQALNLLRLALIER